MGLEVTETLKVTEAGLDELNHYELIIREARLWTAEYAVVCRRLSWKWR
jgi:hypothetical protein